MRTLPSVLAIAVVGCLAAPAAAKPASNLQVRPGENTQVLINGMSAHASITADGPVYPTLNPSVASQLGYTGGLLGADAQIGPITVKGYTDVARFSEQGMTFKKRILWFERPITTHADLEMGPGALPYDTITFILHPRSAGEHISSIPMVKHGSILGANIIVAGKPIFMSWALDRDSTIATAATARLLAERQGGALSGDTTLTPIRFSIMRPTRLLTLEHPIMLPSGPIFKLRARVSDYSNAAGIADSNLDPNEIVVTANRSKANPLYRLSVDRASLANCSSVTFDNKRRSITFSCAN